MPGIVEKGLKQGGIMGVELFNKFLLQNEHYPNLTGELEETGQVTKFMSTTPQCQAIERKIIERQLLLKESVQARVETFKQDYDLLKTLIPQPLGDMSIEDVILIMQKSKNTKIESFEDLLKCMVQCDTEELVKAAGENAESRVQNKVRDSKDADLFSDEALPKTPELTLKPNTPMPTTSRRLIEFPSSSQMISASKTNMTPGPGVFRFGEYDAPITQSAKAPRVCKPGEIAFSIRGSPILLPRVPDRSEVFPVTDEDGKKIAEVVLHPGDQEKRKEYLSIATDIRGLVASRTLRQPHRVQPSRLARKIGPASAKKPEWRS